MAADRKAELEAQILAHVEAHGSLNSKDFLAQLNDPDVDVEDVASVLRSLTAAELLVTSNTEESGLELTTEGREYAENGTPEAMVYAMVPADGSIAMDELKTAAGDKFKVGWGAAMKSRWVTLDKKTKQVTRQVETIVDTVQGQLRDLGSLDKKTAKLLKKRKMVRDVKLRVWTAQKGPKFALERVAEVTDYTAELLAGGAEALENITLKKYNFAALGAPMNAGCLHPVMKVRAEFRQILLQMGFEEMPTNNYVESSFFNFDSLFQPQQHPARDAHDTFFLTRPESAKNLPPEYEARVRRTHEEGGYGSIGYRYDWSPDEARKNILRTHTTAVSARMLYKLAQGPFEPRRFFSIDRVFRNETLDATHLAEFHQVEGLVADRNLTLGDLIGTIELFFKKVGIDDVRFKPAYNPYTEPSMEIFGYSKELGKWIEIGNSGIFRPEMLRPMGLPEDVRVIAWGLSVERPTMIRYNIANIRDLFGPKVKLDQVQTNPIARYDD